MNVYDIFLGVDTKNSYVRYGYNYCRKKLVTTKCTNCFNVTKETLHSVLLNISLKDSNCETQKVTAFHDNALRILNLTNDEATTLLENQTMKVCIQYKFCPCLSLCDNCYYVSNTISKIWVKKFWIINIIINVVLDGTIYSVLRFAVTL